MIETGIEVRSISYRYDPCIPGKAKRFLPPTIKPFGGGLGEASRHPEGGLGDHPQGSGWVGTQTKLYTQEISEKDFTPA